jgi:hypothetical protein
MFVRNGELRVLHLSLNVSAMNKLSKLKLVGHGGRTGGDAKCIHDFGGEN